MKNAQAVLNELKKKGSEKYRQTMERHGCPQNYFGVSVAELKVIAKKIKGEQDIALELYASENGDAQYLAGIVADGREMNKRQLQSWASKASWHMVSEYPVAWVATDSNHAFDMARKWIDAKKEKVATSGWCTWAGIMATKPDDEIDADEIEQLLARVESEIDDVTDRVRYTMNGFVISVGGYSKPLLKQAKATAKKLGKVEVNMGDTACKVPLASEYIAKMEKANRIGKKRKTIKC